MKAERWIEHHQSCPGSNDCEGAWSVGCLCPPFWPRPAAYFRGEMAIGAKAVEALIRKARAVDGGSVESSEAGQPGKPKRTHKKAG